jgi:ubiquinone/menaquinone biosynthesis C-methylase UbiE
VTSPDPPYRDVGAFDERAPRYEQGWLGRLHHEIADRTVALSLATSPAAGRVLDVGCGTGYLLGRLAGGYPHARAFFGVDAAPTMVAVAAATARDDRLRLVIGVAEALPFPDGAFDLVVSTTSFDHWSDQQQGLCECHRVLGPGGRLVLVDQFSRWLAPTLLMGRGDRARTPPRASRLLGAAGFRSLTWHRLYALIINGVTATS